METFCKYFWLIICAVSCALGQELYQTAVGNQDVLSVKAAGYLPNECAEQDLEPLKRIGSQQCHGASRSISISTRSLAPSFRYAEEDVPGILTQEDCLNGCFVRVRPGPNRVCLCLNATTAHKQICNRGRVMGWSLIVR